METNVLSISMKIKAILIILFLGALSGCSKNEVEKQQEHYVRFKIANELIELNEEVFATREYHDYDFFTMEGVNVFGGRKGTDYDFEILNFGVGVLNEKLTERQYTAGEDDDSEVGMKWVKYRDNLETEHYYMTGVDYRPGNMTVTITELSEAHVKGIFSGYLYFEGEEDNPRLLITDGEFYSPIVKEYVNPYF